MDPQIVVRATGDFRRLNSDLAKTEAGFGRMGKRIKGGLAIAAVAGTAALVKLAADSVGAASASQQSLGATETVFGKYADTVIRKSRQAADAVGLSANEYRELANVTGAMLQNAGTPIAKVTTLTERLTKRAADLAATYGGTTKDAIEAVNSLLRGEADPIERYGVSIKQADINARLAAKGLDKLEGSAKKQAEQQARLELLFQQTSKAAGQFGRESDTIAGKGQRLGAKVEDLEAKFGDLLIPALVAGADVADEHLIPALEDLVGWLESNKGEFADMAGTVKDSVLPALSGAVDLGKAAVDIYSELPGPVKDLAVQAGVAALVLPRLTGAVTGVTAGAGSMISSLRNAETRTAALSTAARNAAGIGGLVALSKSTSSSSDAINVLTATAGAAALGFGVGGPWGAAIGGAAGLTYGLVRATNEAGDSVDGAGEAAHRSATDWASYRDTLDQVTGATTRATKAMIIQDLQQSELMENAYELGIGRGTLVNGILGQEKAHDRLTTAIKREKAEIAAWGSARADAEGNLSRAEQKTYDARMAAVEAIEAEIGEVKRSTQAKAEEIAIMRGLPERVVTQIQTPGLIESARDLGQLAAQYNLTPKKIQTIIEMSGIDVSKAEVIALKRTLQETGKVKPDNAWVGFFGADITQARALTGRGVDGINTALRDGTGRARPNLNPFAASILAQLQHMKASASAGGVSIGDNLGSGMYSGLGRWISPISTRSASMVSAAIKSAETAGQIESPSKKTRYIGEMLGAGLEDGISKREKQIRAAARRVVNGMIREGREGVNEFLGDLSTYVRADVDLKNDKKERAREKRILKSLRDEYAALRVNAKAQDVVTAKLEKAREKLAQLRQEYADYAAAIKATVVATGDITQLGRQDDGTVSIGGMLTELRNRVNEAKRFAQLIRELSADGLSQAQIQQMLDAGPEAALATAEAIKAGGSASIKEINDLQKDLADTGQALGTKMADTYYGAGVRAAQGIVAGLEAESKNLDKAAIKLANTLVKAVKKALKIKSPSQEFMGIGDQVTKGLVIGLDDVYVKRAGVKLADSLVAGFENPKLHADVLAGNRPSTTGPSVLEVHLTADVISDAQAGKTIIRKIAAAQADGGRARAVGQTL